MDLDGDLVWHWASGVAGTVGAGARTVSAVRYSSTTTSSTAMDFTVTGTATVTGAAAATGTAASTVTAAATRTAASAVNAGPTIRDTASASPIQTSNSHHPSRRLPRQPQPIAC